MEVLGIKWAPWNVPLSRRAQTAMALFWISSLLTGSFLGVLTCGYFLLFTRAWPLVLTYFVFIYVDRNTCHQGGRKFHWLRRCSLWDYYAEFFPLSLKKTTDLPPDRNYLFCVYPHGLLSAGAFGHFATESTRFRQLFPGLDPHCATLDMHFNTPLFRDYLMGLGAVSASKESIQHVLKSPEKGKVMVLVVGGAAESLYSHPGTYRIILKNRKGFIKMALAAGAPLVPVFSFGETDLYDQVSNPPGSTLLKIQNFLRKYIGMAPCIPIGRGILQYSFGPIPRRCPVTTVVGNPIEVQKIKHPSYEVVQEYHDKFTKELVALFEKHKYDYIKNPEKTELIIV